MEGASSETLVCLFCCCLFVCIAIVLSLVSSLSSSSSLLLVEYYHICLVILFVREHLAKLLSFEERFVKQYIVIQTPRPCFGQTWSMPTRPPSCEIAKRLDSVSISVFDVSHDTHMFCRYRLVSTQFRCSMATFGRVPNVFLSCASA